MLKKNEIIRLEISGMTNEGNGVGKHEGIAVFVPFTVIGDVIECRIVKVCFMYQAECCCQQSWHCSVTF